MALGGVVLVLLAFTFDTAPLFVAGVAFFAIGAGAPAWVWLSARKATLRRSLAADRVVEGEPFESTIEISRGPLGLPGVELHDPLAHAPVLLSTPLSLIRGGRRASVRVVTRFTRRGLRTLEPPSLLVRDPLDLANVRRRGAGPRQELLVLPYTEPVRWRTRRRARRSERSGGRTAGEPLAAIEVDGLRAYQPGTPASRIHWPALARGAGLLERRLRADGDTRPLVVLDLRGNAAEDRIDAAVRAAASLTLELARAAGARLLLPGERRPITVESDLVAWPAAHTRLALVEGGARAPAPIINEGARLGAVFYVSVRAVDRLPPILSGSGQAAAVLVLPQGVRPPVSAQPSFDVTGCHGFLIRAGAFARGERAA